ncbi:MAG TPA: diguanylate cyclase [Polyangiaceae bacterium]|nr:diguanylate cyclase [Polyangiaceae bacterium]
MSRARRVLLVEPDERKRVVLAERLKAQNFAVEAFGDPAEAANFALSKPPHALVANLWMPGVSGVQMCRLLKAEPATLDVPIILRAEGDAPRARFWAEQAGAVAYVPTGRIGELVRALERAISETPTAEGFFMHLPQADIRDRIAQHLDRALFESVIASSVRALGTCESFARLFDLFSQFVCRITTYRWLALRMDQPVRLALHCHPSNVDASLAAAQHTLGACATEPWVVEDEDAKDIETSCPVVSHDVGIGEQKLGTLAIQPLDNESDVEELVRLMATEIAGPLKISVLVEESRRLAQHDPLTGIMNRRAFTERMHAELEQPFDRQANLYLLLLDVDHFKAINDTCGHAGGDRVLFEVGRLLTRCLPARGHLARWGGEEFVLAFRTSSSGAALEFADELRESIANHTIRLEDSASINVTVSIGVAEHLNEEPLESLIERADHAMYAAKVAGRNRVVVAERTLRPAATPSLRVAAG